jgi:hypothetical protein
MKRFLIVIAATAVAAAVTIPAVANDSGADGEATFVGCMRANGVAIPADTRGVAIKQWIAAHESPAVKDALKQCAPAEKTVAVDSLVACLKDRGLNPPSDPVALKPWLAAQDASVVKACGVDLRKADDHAGADIAACLRKNGANVPAGAEGIGLKNWIRDHSDEPAVADALKKCAADKPGACGAKPADPPKPEATPDLTIQQ